MPVIGRRRKFRKRSPRKKGEIYIFELYPQENKTVPFWPGLPAWRSAVGAVAGSAHTKAMFRNVIINAIGASLLLCALAAQADQRDPRLPALFKALKATDDSLDGERIGRRIAFVWNESRRDGIDEVMDQGRNFMAQGGLHLALGNFTAVTKIAPDFAAGWNKRATALYKMGELEAAGHNVGQVLALEPRHFLALLGDGERVQMIGTEPRNHMLLVSAKRLAEPVSRAGPFVMNTREEIIQAFEDYEKGRF